MKKGDYVANYTEEQWNAKKIELMEKCYDGFADLTAIEFPPYFYGI